jgi:hypothetical protein
MDTEYIEFIVSIEKLQEQISKNLEILNIQF